MVVTLRGGNEAPADGWTETITGLPAGEYRIRELQPGWNDDSQITDEDMVGDGGYYYGNAYKATYDERGNHFIVTNRLETIPDTDNSSITAVKKWYPEEELPAITYWLMGSMSRATYQGLLVGLPFILIGAGILFLLRWRLNILSLQEDETKALGIDVKKLRLLVMTASTLVTAACVSLCGQVGWVGLLIPHAARMLYGSDNRKVIPVSIGLGSAFMVAIDTASRAATAAEIPVSILTAIIGAPFFILLLRKTGGARL